MSRHPACPLQNTGVRNTNTADNEEEQGERRMTRLSLSISSQALLSDRTGHGQLRHVSEQRMHYLQVGDHI